MKKTTTIIILSALLAISFFLDNAAANAVSRLHSPSLTTAILLFTNYFVWIYMALLAATMAFVVKNARKNTTRSVITMIGSVAITLAVVYLIKFMLQRERPQGISLKIFTGAENYAFPSSHAATAAAMMFSSRYITPLWAFFTVATMFSRLYINVHFLSDTVGGLLIAAMVSFFIQKRTKAVLSDEDRTELRRRALHLIVGLAIAWFVWKYHAAWYLVILVAVIGIAASYVIKATAAAKNKMIKHVRVFAVAALATVERKAELERFPGKGAIMLFLGAGVTAAVFRQEAAAAIIILAVGDSVSHLAGRLLGNIRHRWLFATEKMVEGTVLGIAAASAAAATITPVWIAVAAATAAMLVEAANIKPFGKKIDDNLTVPITAAAVIWLLRFI